MVEPKSPNEKPSRPAVVTPALQVTIAMACALIIAQTVDWATAAHVLLAVLTVFTTVNRVATPPKQRCVHCGRRQ